MTFLVHEYENWGSIEEPENHSLYIYSLEDTDFTKFDTRISDFTVNEINNFLNKITLEINNSKYKINQINLIQYSKEYYYFDSYELLLVE